MSAPCPGKFYNGLSAQKTIVKVEFLPNSLVITGDGVRESWNKGEYKFERPNNDTFILEFMGKQLIFTRNTIEAYFYNNPLKSDYAFFFKVSRWRPYVIGIVCALALGYWVSLEVSDYFLSQFSLRDQQRAFSFLDGAYTSSSCMTEEAEKVINQILDETGHKETIGRIYYMPSPEVNAFALPSGSIVFTSGFINQIESVEELVAVLFHEIGHVKKRHHLKRFRNAIGLSIVSVLVFQENTGVSDALANFLLNQYSSSQEEESDLYARQKLDQYGISRIGAIDFFERSKDKSNLAIFSTHPSSTKRIEFFQADFPKRTKKEYFPEMLKIIKNCEP